MSTRWLLVAVVFVAGCPRSTAVRSADAACGEGSIVLEGACVSYRVAAAFCGKNASPGPSGCARKTCAPGEALDVDHGMCLPEGVTSSMIRSRGEDETRQRAKCQYGWLSVQGNRVSCKMGSRSCGRGERWAKTTPDAGVPPDLAGSCERVPACGVGEIFDEATGKCARVVRNAALDLGTWARLALGTDGAEGTNAFCAPIRATGNRGKFDVQISVPDNDVTRASARLTAAGTPPGTIDAAQHALDELVQTLHFYGVSSMAATASLSVTCTPEATTPAMLEPIPEVDAGKR